jgi:hypothetical protein
MGEEGPVGVAKMETIMTFMGGDEESTTIWNGETRHAAIFVPSRGEVRFSFRRSDGAPGPFVVRRLREAATGE